MSSFRTDKIKAANSDSFIDPSDFCSSETKRTGGKPVFFVHDILFTKGGITNADI